MAFTAYPWSPVLGLEDAGLFTGVTNFVTGIAAVGGSPGVYDFTLDGTKTNTGGRHNGDFVHDIPDLVTEWAALSSGPGAYRPEFRLTQVTPCDDDSGGIYVYIGYQPGAFDRSAAGTAFRGAEFQLYSGGDQIRQLVTWGTLAALGATGTNMTTGICSLEVKASSSTSNQTPVIIYQIDSSQPVPDLTGTYGGITGTDVAALTATCHLGITQRNASTATSMRLKFEYRFAPADWSPSYWG